jgi:hypothetical protein
MGMKCQLEKRLILATFLFCLLLSLILTFADTEPIIIEVTDSLGHVQTNSWAKGTGGDWSTGVFAYTASIGDNITFVARASDPNIEYIFWVQPPGGGFVVMQDWSTNNKWTWVIDERYYGRWTDVIVGIRDRARARSSACFLSFSTVIGFV